mgnify:CR=1 FL=1
MNIRYPCDHCHSSFTRPHDLSVHKKTTHPDRFNEDEILPWLACTHCPYKTQRPQHIKRHYETVHPIITATHDVRVVYCCEMCKQTFDQKKQLDRHSCNSSRPVSPTATVYIVNKPQQAEQAELKRVECDVKSTKISLEIAVHAEKQLALEINKACAEVTKAEETVTKAKKMLLTAQAVHEGAKTKHSKASLAVKDIQKEYNEKSKFATLITRRHKKKTIKAKIERLRNELMETEAQFEAIEPTKPALSSLELSPIVEASRELSPIVEPPTVCKRCPKNFNSHIEWCYHLNFTCQGVCATAIQRWWRRRGVLSKPKRTLKRKRNWDDDEDFLLIAQHKKHGIHFSRYDMPERTRSSIKARYYRLFKENPLRLWREVEL